jgi:hypothetical protein
VLWKREFRAPEMRLYDGMARAVQLLKAQPSSYRRIMLVVGESRDYSSEAQLGQVLREAQLASIMIYAIGPSSTTAIFGMEQKVREEKNFLPSSRTLFRMRRR